MNGRREFLAGALSLPLPARADPAATPGLTLGENGGVRLHGAPYRGVGVNYFDVFLRQLQARDDRRVDDGFRTLAGLGIPFARFCATGFWPKDVGLLEREPAEYFDRLDAVVAAAERHGLGLVPSLFWNFSTLPDLVGEPMDQWGNPDSRTHARMREYTRAVVTRLRGSRAVWAWELGNEYSLQASLPNAAEHRAQIVPALGTPASRSARDDLTFPMVRTAFAAFGRAVREHDPHRLVFTGDSFPRLSAWHQEKENSWKHDSPEQFREMLERANPAPIDGISLHAYEDDDQRLPGALEVSRRLNKPLFVGEFGAQHDTPGQRAKFERLFTAITTSGVPLAAVWVYDYARQPDFNLVPGSPRAYQLERIGEWNRSRKS